MFIFVLNPCIRHQILSQIYFISNYSFQFQQFVYSQNSFSPISRLLYPSLHPFQTIYIPIYSISSDTDIELYSICYSFYLFMVHSITVSLIAFSKFPPKAAIEKYFSYVSLALFPIVSSLSL